MTSCYPFLTVHDAKGITLSTYNTPGLEPRPVLVIKVLTELGDAALTLHINGLTADVIAPLVAAIREPETV